MKNKYWRMLLGAIALPLALVGTPTAWAGKIPADAPGIQYFGRWDAQGGVYRCGRGATYIKANFTGTSLKADLSGAGIWWRASIDGGPFRRLSAQGENTVLATNLPLRQHSIRLVRSTEGNAGISEFRGLTVDENSSLAPPDPLSPRRLEFVGDSIAAGAMNDGHWRGDNYHDVEDGDMAFGPQLARLLGADYSVVAKSGEGIAHNYSEAWPGTGVHACDSYAWTFYHDTFSPQNQLWDAARFPVDAVIIASGTNDFLDDRRRPTAAEFKAGYHRLVAVVRRLNPGCPIICTEPVPSRIGRDARKWIRQTVAEAKAAGDKNIYFIPLNQHGRLLSDADYVGDGIHPTQQGSAKIAAYLKDKVAAILGWN